MPSRPPVPTLALWTITAAAVMVLPGCLKRTISITSDPPGALVWLGETEVGRTPLETDFTFYGTYDVRLRLDGYEPVTVERDADSPIYEYPPFDLLAEALPLTISTTIDWHFVLDPTPEWIAAQTGDEALKRKAERDLLDRAELVRRRVGGLRPTTEPRPAPEPRP